MGIKGLFTLLKKEAPNSYREVHLKVFTGKKVACDASNVRKISKKGDIPISCDNNRFIYERRGYSIN